MPNTQTPRLVELQAKGGKDGYLIPLEENSTLVPFAIKRVYYIYNVNSSLRRGFHAHKKLKQLIICISGECTIELDDTQSRHSYKLNRPNEGLLIEKPIWREMCDFSTDCILMVLASEHYDPEDYIQNFREFKDYLRSEAP